MSIKELLGLRPAEDKDTLPAGLLVPILVSWFIVAAAISRRVHADDLAKIMIMIMIGAPAVPLTLLVHRYRRR